MQPILYIFLSVLVIGALLQLCAARRRRKQAQARRDREDGFDVERGRQSDGYGATARVWE